MRDGRAIVVAEASGGGSGHRHEPATRVARGGAPEGLGGESHGGESHRGEESHGGRLAFRRDAGRVRFTRNRLAPRRTSIGGATSRGAGVPGEHHPRHLLHHDDGHRREPSGVQGCDPRRVSVSQGRPGSRADQIQGPSADGRSRRTSGVRVPGRGVRAGARPERD